ncbi:MAG: acetate/propionate family kinase [Casimicrobiaceae bacterium]
MPDAILVINAGSSSLKYALYAIDTASLVLLQSGLFDGLTGTARFSARDAKGAPLASKPFIAGTLQPHAAAIDYLLDFLRGPLGLSVLAGVGHRVVHGGTRYADPVRVTADVINDLQQLVPLAPLHQPHNLAPIRVFAEREPALPQVACFDTAFHRTLPPVAQTYALPREMTAAGIRRYGFHGLSYEFIAARLREIDPALAKGRVVVAHLGNGASMCAIHDGRSVATTMGMTALEGLMMGTRTGSIDPGVLLYLQRERGMDERALEDLLYHRSGLLGVSGVASDVRVLLASEDPHARFAIELFCYRAVCEIGALAASMGGIDALVFTAGIGEHAARVRELIVAPLAWLGFACDATANAQHTLQIGTRASKPLYVIATDEEQMIAEHTRCIIGR